MGQKVNPIGFRVGVDHDWRSRWFADKRSFGDFLAEDCVLRDAVAKALKEGAVSEVRIERYANRVRLNIHTARPGIVMGKGGEEILLSDETIRDAGKCIDEMIRLGE